MSEVAVPRELRAYLRQDFSIFAEKAFRCLHPGASYRHNWHIDHLAWALERVARGDLQRLIINMPPRMGKSIIASVAFPAWCLGHDPTKKIMCLSYDRSLARKFSSDTRQLMEQDWYRGCFPKAALTVKRAQQLQTAQGGYRFASGRSGDVLGRGADLIILDDPMKPAEAMTPRLVPVALHAATEHAPVGHVEGGDTG